MKKFIFRLESVLQERKRQEDFRLREWSIVNKMLLDLKDQQRNLEEKKIQVSNHISDLMSMKSMNVSIIQTADQYLHGLNLQIQWKKEDITRAEKFVARKKDDWLQARKKRMILEKLKEKKNAEHKKDAAKREQRLVDDLNLMRARLTEPEENI
jgi:flagellar FliJ protein